MMAEIIQAGENGWLTTWKVVLLVVGVLFAGMGAVVSVGAVRDLFSMFRDLRHKGEGS